MPYHHHPVIAVIPAGRERYLRLLIPHLVAARDLIDRCDLWLNTDVPSDLDYLAGLAKEFPDFFRPVRSSSDATGLDAIYGFYTEAYRVPGTIYLKIDDDIVWLEPGAIRRLLEFRVRHPNYFLVSADVWNNQRCDHVHQRCGLIPPEPPIEWNIEGSCWRNGRAAEAIHRLLLSALDRGLGESWLSAFDRYVIRAGERLSFNLVSWFGEDMAALGDLGLSAPFPGGDEDFFCKGALEILGKDNAICGGALAAHFAFGPQRAHMDRTDLLEKWAALLPHRQAAAMRNGGTAAIPATHAPSEPAFAPAEKRA